MLDGAKGVPMTLTCDPNDPRLGRGVDETPRDQQDAYLVLCDEEQELVRPVRLTYIHARELGGCGTVTTMDYTIAETYAKNPAFYGATYCVGCRMHRPVGDSGEFYWDGTTEKVGT